MDDMTRTPEQEQEQKEKLEVKQGEAGKAPSRWMSPIDEMERIFDEYFPRGWLRRWEWPALPEFARRMELRMPKVDVIDRDEEVVVKAEIPGVDKNDLDVSMAGNAVTIKGQSHHEEKEEKGDFYRCEISRGAFSRTVNLPAEVDASQAQASFRDGMLELRLPKKPEAKRQPISVE